MNPYYFPEHILSNLTIIHTLTTAYKSLKGSSCGGHGGVVGGGLGMLSSSLPLSKLGKDKGKGKGQWQNQA